MQVLSLFIPRAHPISLLHRNKTSSAVQLRHIPTGIVVKSQETRSREQNRKIARQILASKLEDIEKGDQSRNSVLKDVARKRKASKRKKSLRKYRKLDEEKHITAGQLGSGSDVEPVIAGELEDGEFEDEFGEDEDEDNDDGEDGEKVYGNNEGALEPAASQASQVEGGEPSSNFDKSQPR
ncbi:hypothetical protein ABW19_dt0204190 [Dactylella cylindrospora]|nr:hypothetical protein ABW19_dt0204190 [Dactylella cylindrospora]